MMCFALGRPDSVQITRNPEVGQRPVMLTRRAQTVELASDRSELCSDAQGEALCHSYSTLLGRYPGLLRMRHFLPGSLVGSMVILRNPSLGFALG
jgi:hypothetical protein